VYRGRSLKGHFLTAEGIFSAIVQHTFSQVFDIKNGPGVEMEFWAAEGYSHLWVMKPVMVILTDLAISMRDQYEGVPEYFTGRGF